MLALYPAAEAYPNSPISSSPVRLHPKEASQKRNPADYTYRIAEATLQRAPPLQYLSLRGSVVEVVKTAGMFHSPQLGDLGISSQSECHFLPEADGVDDTIVDSSQAPSESSRATDKERT